MALLLLLCPKSALAEDVAVGAAGAVLLDVNTTRVLASKNAHAPMPMASTTKAMTALLAVERGNLDAMVTVPDAAYGVEGSSMYLNRGEKLSLRDLLYGLMLSSGNDAAVTIATHIGGSLPGFIQMMNSRARELGCVNTNFVTPNGLHDPDHYTTAYDLGLIAAAAMKNPLFREIVSTQYHKTTTGDIMRTLKNKNKILWQYEGGNGVKTGYTKAAGKCLVFSAEREGNTIVGVVLNASNMWNDAVSYLDAGFSRYEWKTVFSAGEGVQTIKIGHGMKNSLEAMAKNDILVPVRKDGEDKPEIRVDCPMTLEAPILEGQSVGRVEVWCDGRMMASTTLVAKNTVLRKEYPYYLWRIMEGWSA